MSNIEEQQPSGRANETTRPYWKKAHRDWRFWVAVFFIFLALAVYIGSGDLSLVPHTPTSPPQPQH